MTSKILLTFDGFVAFLPLMTKAALVTKGGDRHSTSKHEHRTSCLEHRLWSGFGKPERKNSPNAV